MAIDDATRASDAGALGVRSPAAAVLPIGFVVDGAFRIEQVLGRGGTAVVYLARDLGVGREVALKLGSSVSDEATRRIEREAQALGRLVHPNVIVIHRIGRFGDQLYLAMEYVAGGTVRHWLETERTTREILELYCAAGDGLVAAHAAGFVHRDFKPDNVLVGADGRPRVADFGLVAATVAPSTAFGALTMTGAVMGTPAYMAPEQLEGRPADARADQFALCVAIWEALFRTRPFPGHTMAEVVLAIAHEPKLPADPRGVPSRTIRALLRGLARDPDRRWPSVAALLHELRRRPRRRRLVAAGVAITAVGLIVAAAAIATRPPTSAPSSAPAKSTGSRTFPTLTLKVPRDHPLVVVRDGVSFELDPRHVDVAKFIAWAIERTKAIVPDARLTRISADGVRADGFADLRLGQIRGRLELTVAGHIQLSFVSRARDELRTCMLHVDVTRERVQFHAWGECEADPVAAPRCSPARIWARLRARHPEVAADTWASFDYSDVDGTGTWHVSAHGGTDERLVDDC